MQEFLIKQKLRFLAQHWCSAKIFPSVLKKRLSDKGTENNLYCISNFFHPFFQGDLVKTNSKMGNNTLNTLIQKLVSEHPNTSKFLERKETDSSPWSGSLANEMDEIEKETMERKRKGKSDVGDDNRPPLQIEIDAYMNAQCKNHTINPLEWWKEHREELPLLSALACHYLCIQVTSGSSERAFSTGGQDVSYKRTNLTPSHASKLVFIIENINYIKTDVKKWAKEEEEILEPDSEEEEDVFDEDDDDDDYIDEDIEDICVESDNAMEKSTKKREKQTKAASCNTSTGVQPMNMLIVPKSTQLKRKSSTAMQPTSSKCVKRSNHFLQPDKQRKQ